MTKRRLFLLDLQIPLSDLWPLLIPVVLLLPGLTGFPYPSPDAPYSDIAVSHYPNAIFLKSALQTWGSVPLWSPSILSGYPFFANPLSGLWYLPGLFALLFPLPLGFNLLVIAHMIWGGLGLYLFLRFQRLNHHAALFGALAFQALPKFFAHYGAGHLSLLYALPWTPWLLLAAVRSRNNSSASSYLWVSVILAIIFFADVRWAVFAGALWLAWEFAQGQRRYFRLAAIILRGTILSALIAAPLALPLLEYSSLSTRANLAPKDVLAFSLPPARLLGFIFPDFSSPHEWTLYIGGVVMLLAALAILWPRCRNRSSFWIWIFVISILFSLGENIPGLQFIACLPGFSLLRVPSRALFITGMAGAILAAHALNHLLVSIRDIEALRARLALVSLTVFSLALTTAIWLVNGQFPLNVIWGSVIILVISIWIMLYFSGRIPKKIWLSGIFLIMFIDLGFVNSTLFSHRPTSEVLIEGKAAAEFIASQPGKFRVYSPSYSIPQQTAASYNLELVDGVDPLQLEVYVNFMREATGIPKEGYSVTLPSFGSDGDDLANANAEYIPTALLAKLNVRFIVSEFDMDIEYLALTHYGSTRVYEISNDLGYTYILGAENQSVETVAWTPNRIELQAKGPGRLVISEIPYPGWQVFVDGNQVKIESIDGVNRAVELPEGNHAIEFVFRPLSLFIGLGISVITMVGMVIASRRIQEIATIE